MRVKTSRFGDLTINRQDILSFKDGLLGFEHLKQFFIVDPGDNTLILWLQSIEIPEVAFPVIEPKIFSPLYKVSLLPIEKTALSLEGFKDAIVYTILTIPEDVTQMSANLKAPIIINNVNKLARQVVLQDNKLPVSLPIYKDFKKNILNFISDDSKRTNILENAFMPEGPSSKPKEKADTEIEGKAKKRESDLTLN